MFSPNKQTSTSNMYICYIISVQVVESITNISLKSGMKVEVVDKMCVSAMRVASVDEIIGGRLRLQYVDSMVMRFSSWRNTPVTHQVSTTSLLRSLKKGESVVGTWWA